MAVSINYDMDQGATFSFSLTATNDDGTTKGITSGKAALGIPSFITGGTGYILVSLSATGTSQTKPGVYFYDVELQSSNGSVVQRLVQGMITVYPEVTRV